MNLQGKKVLVCGMALSGISAARFLLEKGARVTIQDLKDDEKYQKMAARLNEEGILTYLGKNPDDIITQQDLIVMSPGVPTDLPFVNIARKENVPIWAEIELAYHYCPAPVVAITGTNGKTTTTALMGQIFKCWNDKTEVVGNIGIPFTQRLATLTAKHYVVAEVSSFQLETIVDFRPRVSAVLNITPDHLNRHKTMARYVEAKAAIFQNQQADDFTILNYDNNYTKELALKTKGQVVFFSRVTKLAQGAYLDNDFITWQGQKLLHINELKVLGLHNIENALAAVAMSVCAGVPFDIIKKGLESFKGVAHRMEFVRELDGVFFYNDSKATNPDAAIKSIEALAPRPIVLIGGGSNKDSDFSSWVKCFPNAVKHFIAIGECADKILETCKAYNFTNTEKVHSLKDAVTLAKARATPGDCVVLAPACASWDMFDSFEQRGNLFKEFVLNG